MASWPPDIWDSAVPVSKTIRRGTKKRRENGTVVAFLNTFLPKKLKFEKSFSSIQVKSNRAISSNFKSENLRFRP